MNIETAILLIVVSNVMSLLFSRWIYLSVEAEHLIRIKNLNKLAEGFAKRAIELSFELQHTQKREKNLEAALQDERKLAAHYNERLNKYAELHGR